MNGKRKIKPETPGGFRDYTPEQMAVRRLIFEKIRRVFEKFGYEELDTPAVEFRDVLTGGKETEMQIYNVSLPKTKTKIISRSEKDKEERQLSLHFDLTVPLARFVAANLNKIPRPFKRYQIAKVWRGEKSQAGRFNEFIQFDADIVGSSSMIADTEVIWLIYEVMKELGFNRFIIKFNNRKVLNALAIKLGMEAGSEKAKELFRLLDKIESIGWDEVKKELMRTPENRFDELALNLTSDQADFVEKFISISGPTDEIIKRLKEMFADADVEIGLEGTKELEEIVKYLKILGIPEENWKVDLSIARGLDYYTGPVFETFLLDLPEIGSVFSGGRYDTLVSRFCDATIPCTGASIGVDRLFTAMEKLNLIPKTTQRSLVLVTCFSEDLTEESLKITAMIRKANIPCEIYTGEERTLRAQIAYATKKQVPQVPIVIIIGPEEKEKNTAILKDMEKRVQREVPQNLLIPEIKKILDDRIRI